MKEYTSSEISVLLLSEIWEGEKSNTLATDWDEKWNNMNTQDNSFEVWMKLGVGGEDRKFLLAHTESFIFSISVCLQSVSNHKLDNKSVIKLAIP